MRLAAKLTLPVSEDQLSPDERTGDRTRLRLDGAVSLPSADAHEITLDDLSANGFAASCPVALRPGKVVEIRFGETVRRAEIVRQSNGAIAGRFTTPLSPAELRGAIAGSPVVWGQFAPAASFTRSDDVDDGAMDGSLAIRRWPGSVRLGIIGGGSLLLWTLIYAVL